MDTKGSPVRNERDLPNCVKKRANSATCWPQQIRHSSGISDAVLPHGNPGLDTPSPKAPFSLEPLLTLYSSVTCYGMGVEREVASSRGFPPQGRVAHTRKCLVTLLCPTSSAGGMIREVLGREKRDYFLKPFIIR